MEYELRIVVEKVAVSSQQVVNRDTLKIYDVKAPASILELGLRHRDLSVRKVQNSVLAAQSKLIDTGYDVCPKCGDKLNKTGHAKSNFHAVFTDHQVGRNINAVILSDWQYSHNNLCVRHLYSS